MKVFFKACLLFIGISLSAVLHAPCAPVSVVPEGFAGARQPQVVIDLKSNVFVAFGRKDSIYCASSLDGGKSFKSPVLVGNLKHLALGMRRGPRIASTARGP